MKYVVKLVGLPDVIVEIEPPNRLLLWREGGVLTFWDGTEMQWAYAPGQWKSVHKLPDEEVIR